MLQINMILHIVFMMFVDFFKSQYVITKSVVDPGFPRREPTPEFGVKTYYLPRY